MQYDHKLHTIVGPTGIRCQLSPQSHKLLSALLDNPYEVLSRDTLRQKVWGHEYVSDDAINHAFARLRSKIKKVQGCDHWRIESLPGAGYRICIIQPMQDKPPKNWLSNLKNWFSTSH